jgi:diguanylate cyclase (GGDEF)-like protein
MNASPEKCPPELVDGEAEVRQWRALVRHLSEYDPLTDLPNRTLLLRRMHGMLNWARESGQKVAVMFADLDRFDEINATMGHSAGDALLQATAHRISAAVRHPDVVSRISADEFVVLLPGLLDMDDAACIVQKVLEAVREPLNLQGEEVSISASIGIAMFPRDGTQAEELLRNAAAAMSRVKQERRNSYQFYTRELSERAAELLRLENALRQALEHQELVLHFQPQIDLRTAAIVGAEALVRWDRPGEGLVPPGQFIPFAEERGLILPIGDWVIEQAARQVRAWDRGGAPPITMAVNISASQFRHPELTQKIADEIRATGVDPSRLELELTESIAVHDKEMTTRTVGELRRLGVRLSLDDFGTGYSSLSYLDQFPLDKLKIDQSFIHKMTGDPRSTRVVCAIMALARSFGLKVIAEGVETREQLAALRAEGCDEVQGYLVSPPLAPDEFLRFVRDWKGLPF